MRRVGTRGPAFSLRYSQVSFLILSGISQNTLIFRYSNLEAAVRRKDKNDHWLHRLGSWKVINLSGLYSIPTAAAKAFFPIPTLVPQSSGKPESHKMVSHGVDLISNHATTLATAAVPGQTAQSPAELKWHHMHPPCFCRPDLQL